MSQILLHFRALIVACALLVAGAGQLPGQPARRSLQLDDWYALKNVGGLTVSPDGRTAAFTVSEIDRAKDRRVSSLFSNFATDDLRLWWIRELGFPWRNVELYRKLSPSWRSRKSRRQRR